MAQQFRDGELAFVSELHLSALGGVRVTVRTLAGRLQIMLIDDGSIRPALSSFEPADRGARARGGGRNQRSVRARLRPNRLILDDRRVLRSAPP